jgi:hypothetical protein
LSRTAESSRRALLVGLDGVQHPDRYVATLDVGLTNDRTVVVVAHAEQGPARTTVVVDRLHAWQGKRVRPVSLEALKAWVEAACSEYCCSLLFDPYQAQHLAQRLRTKHVRGTPPSKAAFSLFAETMRARNPQSSGNPGI